jgi:uncharacterized protein (TIGR00730 family)
MNICVYCSSSNLVDGRYMETARDLGRELALRGWPLVYGGGSVGLMGRLAESVHAGGGRVVGVIPQGLLDREVGYLRADELLVTTTLRERKQAMDDRADAFVALPGGFGTLEELIENVTLRQLGYHDKPIIIVNVDGFYEPLLAQFERCFEQSFTAQHHRRLYSVVSSVGGVIDILERYRAHRELPPELGVEDL